MERDGIVDANGAPKAIGPFCHARWANGLLFISGQVGLDPRTGRLLGDQVTDQVDQIMHNLHAVLTAAKLGWENLVKTTIYLTDMNDYQAVNKTYAAYFKNCENFPSRVCIQVAALPLAAKVEIEAVALK